MTSYPVSKKSMVVMAAVFAMAVNSSSAVAGDAPEVQHAGSIAYITGGIGDEERDALRAVQRDYNLHILSAGIKGAYVGDAHMIISDSHGQELLDTDAGPIFYAHLPAGHYVVQEDRHGESKKQSLVIGMGKPANITFRWN